MYIVFLGIIPSILLIMLLFYYSRHNVLPFWKRPRKSYVDLLPCTKRQGSTNNSKNSKPTSNSSKSFFNKIPFFNYNTHRLRNMLNFHSKTPKMCNYENNISVSQIDTHIYDVPDCNNTENKTRIQINFDCNKPLPEAPKNQKSDRIITKADIVINKDFNVNMKGQNEMSNCNNAEEVTTNKNINNKPLSTANSNIIINKLPKVEISNPISDIKPAENSIVKTNELSVLITNARNNLNKSPKPYNKHNIKPLVNIENDSYLNTDLANAKNNLSKSPKPTVKNITNSVTVANIELNSNPSITNNNLPKTVNNINDAIKTSVVLKAKPKTGNKPNINKSKINKEKPIISKAKPSIEKKELASTTNELITKGNVANKAHMFNKNY